MAAGAKTESLFKASKASGSAGRKGGAEDACPLAARVLPVGKARDEFEDIRREGERDAFSDIITALWHDRSRILTCQRFLKKAGN